jgi:hypothetical protein
MRSRKIFILLAIAVGFLLAFLPIWPVFVGLGVSDDFEHMQSDIYHIWHYVSIVTFYRIVPEIRKITIVAEVRIINNLLAGIYPFILLFLSWIIAVPLRRMLIYLWDLP